MKFLSGARNRSICYVIDPMRPITDMTTGRTSLTKPLRAKFKDHRFDSEAAQKAGGWNDKERKRVEEALINHADFGRSDGRGVFYDNSSTLAETELRARGVKRRCMYMQDIGEDTLQCSEYVTEPDADYCDMHLPIVVAATTGKGAGQEVSRAG